MSDVLSRELPAPKRWQELESLAFDIYRRLWKTSDAELHGRTGQPQAGVDVYGTNRVEQLFTGVQCKGKDADYNGTLTEKELRDEVAKALTFQPPLDVYIVVTTAPNDAAIQRVARDISAEHKKKGLFEVRVTGWDTLRHYVADYPELLLKYFRDFAPVDILGQLTAASEDRAQGFSQIAKMIQTGQRMLADIRDDKVGNDELASRVTEVSKLIGDGSPKAALKRLDQLMEDEGATASPLAKYRLLASKGNALYALGDEKAAISQFREAHAAYPTFANARATLAIAYLLEGDKPKAFELATGALADDPSSARTAGILIDAIEDGTPLDKIEALIAPDLLADPEVKLHLALRAHSLGDDASHRRLAEEALAIAPDDWRMLSAVAEGIIQPLSSVDGLALTRSLPEGSRADVDRAVDLTRKAWANLAQRDSSFQGRHVAANLINLLRLVGCDEEAETVIDQAFATNPKYDPLARHKAERLASKGDWSTAAAILDAVPEAEQSFDTALLRTQTALMIGDPSSAKAALRTLVAKAADEPALAERDQLIAAFRIKVDVLAGAERDDAIKEAITVDPKAVVLRSLLFDDLPEDSALRARLVAEISDLAKGNITLRERVHAAETLYAAGSYSLAADLYEALHNRSESYALRRQLQALFLSDRRAEARKLFDSLPTELKISADYLRIGINIYERAGLLKPALKLVEHAIAKQDSLQTRLAWLQLLLRLGRRDKILPWLREVSEDIDGEPLELISLARIIDQYLGQDPRALAIGYRALRAGYGQPRIHLAYAMGLVLNTNPDGPSMSPPPTVEPGSGVALKNQSTGEMIFRIIETLPDPVIERGEIGPNDPFAQRLVGLKVGDTLDLDKIGGRSETFRVEEIQSRYLFAFRRALRDFPSLFPGNSAFGSIDIDERKGDDRFEEMFALARARADYAKQVEALYRDNVVPLPMMAKFTGSNVFDLWESFSRVSTLGLKSALGVPGEFEAGRRAAQKPVTLVDPVSIYAWARLGLTEILISSPRRLAVVQATIDALRELVEERQRKRGREMGTFFWDGEHYQLVDLTDEVVDQQVLHASNALAFAEALLLVPSETDRVVPEHVAKLLEDLNPAYHDALLAALQPKRSLLTDDIGFRVVAQEAGVAVTWTQSFAQAGLGPSGISQPAYRQVIGALMDANYEFTQFGHLDVLGELLDSGWSINARLRDFALKLAGENLDRASVGVVLGRLLIDSIAAAPTDQNFAAFHVEYARVCRDAERTAELVHDYDRAMQVAYRSYLQRINLDLLPRKLRASTYLTSPEILASDSRRIAKRAAERLWQSLRNGGLSVEIA